MKRMSSKHWLSELFWVLLSAIFSLLLVFTFFKVASLFGDSSFGVGDTYFLAETSIFFLLVYSAIGSWTFIMRAATGKFKNLPQIIVLTLFIGLSIYLLHQTLPSEEMSNRLANEEGWLIYPPLSSLSFKDRLEVLGSMFFKGVWAVWLYFGLILSFIALLGRIFWLARVAKKTSKV
ncbi:MAG: hypothetical protein COW03_17845 [Cytophagales bacterium CG12_big_fil_rev_8_21_14_0_65_40_12]|nr:MAG: hypothetical protein COW03_17845 [Cytophagales bacterium CG12_big_fil_rev_8_21_14_0_65_40_12]PIW06192.1 MAG: hypothetical protein COW40_00600 [Cytophagales bacterium CG17_big_fil_post_rev_8_21_14_2_50_40_13]